MSNQRTVYLKVIKKCKKKKGAKYMKIEQGIQSEKTASVAGEEGNVRFCLS